MKDPSAASTSERLALVRFTLARGAGKVVIETFAEGALAAAAYDLTIATTDIAGEAMIDASNLERSTATLEIGAGSFAVEALRRHATGHPAVVTAADARQIHDKVAPLLRDAFGNVLHVALGEGVARGPGRARLVARVRAANGSTSTSSIPLHLDMEARLDPESGALTASGSAEASLRALGLPPVRGPLGVFRVADRIRVRFHAEVRPA